MKFNVFAHALEVFLSKTSGMKYLILIFALIAILSGHAAGTTDTVCITPTPRQISILTYNIKMLPRAAISIGHHPVLRAKLIPAKMIEENPDVIVFQEGLLCKKIQARIFTLALPLFAFPFLFYHLRAQQF